MREFNKFFSLMDIHILLFQKIYIAKRRNTMILVDAHCDTITKIMEDNENLVNNKCHIDIERAKKAGGYVQFFAAFIDPAYCQAYAMRRALQIIDRFYQELEKNNNDMMLCCNYNDIQQAINESKIAAVLSIEGGEALQGELSSLRMFYKLGVRSICLTWNHRNEIADGVSDRSSGGGLTPFGKKVVEEMNSLGMLIDVSHISEKGFWDVLELTRSPIIASHSNSQSICSHVRNLTDEQIKAIGKNGGVMGINFYPAFLNDSKKASVTDIVNHIEHMASLVGCDYIGIGADFDGVEALPEGINGLQDVEKVINTLLKLNYSQEWVEKITGLNFLRVIKSVL
jgi:membrane dipeptidase